MLSVAVLLGWQMFYAGPKLKEEQERRRASSSRSRRKAKAAQPGAPSAVPRARPARRPQPGAAPAGAPVVAARNAARPRSRPARAFVVETPSLKGSIALKGGRIDDLVLAKYRETVDPKSPNVVLFSPSGAPHPYYAEYGWVAGAGVTQPMPGPRYALAGRRRTGR